MPHNEPCPVCGQLLADWHWEWHNVADYRAIYKGAAAMECPVCLAGVMFVGGYLPLAACPEGSAVERVKRDVVKAATWNVLCNVGTALAKYLTTAEGRPYANYWSQDEVNQADRLVAAGS